jgi:hypothetical protein
MPRNELAGVLNGGSRDKKGDRDQSMQESVNENVPCESYDRDDVNGTTGLVPLLLRYISCTIARVTNRPSINYRAIEHQVSVFFVNDRFLTHYSQAKFIRA